jgi:hypothetical protein
MQREKVSLMINLVSSVTLFHFRMTDSGILGWGVSNPPNFRSFDKAEPNSQFCGIYIHNNLIGKQVSLICKLSGTPD